MDKIVAKGIRENNLDNDPSYAEDIGDIYDQMLLNYYFGKKINKDLNIKLNLRMV